MTVYLLGLDLGQAADFSALVLDQALPAPRVLGAPRRPADDRPLHTILHAERYRGVPYPEVVRRARRLIEAIAVQDERAGRLRQDVVLVVDATGVGRAVLDLLIAADLPVDRLVAMNITGGQAVTWGDGFVGVPKKDLVFSISRVAQEGRLRISSRLSLAKVLVAELRAFRVKVTASGADTFEAARERDHDDLVLATSLAVWGAERWAVTQPERCGVVAVNWR